MTGLGTRDQFRGWLHTTHGMTYSRYTKLDTAAKLDLQGQYQGRAKVKRQTGGKP